ncbi:MAG: hypothetical protein LBL24_05255 [Bacteroidales bacterium]|jgi:hypothetical protein|nr:hypothetical protein [Bacteroidales bacterium]
MAKTKEELLRYAVKMRQRGDTYYDIKQYLERNASDEETVNAIITIINELEKNAKPVQQKRKDIPVLNIVLGSGFLILGFVLIFVLWNRGFVSMLPLLLIIIGITALTSTRLR